MSVGGLALMMPPGGAARWSLGCPVVRGPIAITPDLPGLTSGVAVYTPAVGELILKATIDVLTDWNGTTPTADVGTFVGTNDGWLRTLGVGVTFLGSPSVLPDTVNRVTQPGLDEYGQMIAITATDPIRVVVSQDGRAGGSAASSTVGAAALYLVTAVPGT